MMEKRRYYINGMGLISPQVTYDPTVFLEEPREYDGNVLTCVTPDFKAYINPVQMRRLSRMLRIGLVAAVISVREAGNDKLDGIITSTGYGFLDDTAKFLIEMLSQGEKQLTPTYFMQSTYNSLGGLVALSLKCAGYNSTHVSKGVAFETALMDAMMQIHHNPTLNFLVGGYDEADRVQYAVNSKAGHYKAEKVPSLNLFESGTDGSLQGESAAFFFLSARAGDNAWCQLLDIRMLYKPTEGEVSASIHEMLGSNGLSTDTVDVVINGASGDSSHDRLINKIAVQDFGTAAMLKFKHLCGEFCTASSFALWLGASILKKQHIPTVVRVNSIERRAMNTVLIINQYLGRNYSLILLSR